MWCQTDRLRRGDAYVLRRSDGKAFFGLLTDRRARLLRVRIRVPNREARSDDAGGQGHGSQ